MHGLSSFEPCDLRKNYFIFVTSYYGQWGTWGGNLLVGFNTCFLHDKLHSLYTDNPITDERKINCNGIAMKSGANKIDVGPMSVPYPVRPCYGLENPSIRMSETRFFF